MTTLKDELSGADIKAICTEAGLLALRERRMKVDYGHCNAMHWLIRFLYDVAQAMHGIFYLQYLIGLLFSGLPGRF